MTASPTRSYFSEHDRAEVWRRWKEGESLAAIGRALNRRAPSIYYILSKSGGVKQPPKKRSRMHLTMSKREEISRGIVQHKSIRSIAKNLGRTPSSISREIRKNGGISHYRAHASDKKAWERA